MTTKIDRKTMVTLVIVLIGMLGIYYMTSSVIPRVLVTMTKAAPATKVSFTASRVIGSKLLAKADGEDKCVVNVFVMDDSGKGVKGKAVELTGADDIESKSNFSDETGKATFEIKSAKAGQFTLRAMVEGIELDQTVRVTFR